MFHKKLLNSWFWSGGKCAKLIDLENHYAGKRVLSIHWYLQKSASMQPGMSLPKLLKIRGFKVEVPGGVRYSSRRRERSLTLAKLFTLPGRKVCSGVGRKEAFKMLSQIFYKLLADSSKIRSPGGVRGEGCRGGERRRERRCRADAGHGDGGQGRRRLEPGRRVE